jgi:hypothetical protein
MNRKLTRDEAASEAKASNNPKPYAYPVRYPPLTFPHGGEANRGLYQRCKRRSMLRLGLQTMPQLCEVRRRRGHGGGLLLPRLPPSQRRTEQLERRTLKRKRLFSVFRCYHHDDAS